jgi:hypothetical protein
VGRRPESFATKGESLMFLRIPEPTLKEGVEVTLFAVVAITILIIGVFRLDTIFHRRKRPEKPKRPRKQRMYMIVEPTDDPESEHEHEPEREREREPIISDRNR